MVGWKNQENQRISWTIYFIIHMYMYILYAYLNSRGYRYMYSCILFFVNTGCMQKWVDLRRWIHFEYMFASLKNRKSFKNRNHTCGTSVGFSGRFDDIDVSVDLTGSPAWLGRLWTPTCHRCPPMRMPWRPRRGASAAAYWGPRIICSLFALAIDWPGTSILQRFRISRCIFVLVS
jgi:hypothetical protein